MSKKILILGGSPRKDGNSDIFCDEFRKVKATNAMQEAYRMGQSV